MTASGLVANFNVLSLTDSGTATTKPALRIPSVDERLARYKPIRRLRKTLYGDTVLCQDTRSPHEKLVVLKRMNLQALRDNTAGAYESPAAERRAIELVHRAGGNPHIVHYERNAGDGSPMFVHRGNLYTAMEYCAEGDLLDHVERQPQLRLGEHEALDLIHQTAAGLAFLHSHGVAHRDVSLENVLLTSDGTAKLCDFGLSCDASTRHCEVVGKASYMAPEVARGHLYDPRSADMWSLGVVLFTMLTGAPLIANEAVRDRVLRVLSRYGVAKVLELWGMHDLVGPATLVLLSSLLQVDPEARPTVESVLRDAAFWAA
jgi:5'-AMP-activated protein kinase catalytic alpha subunit/calcium-dependent protein kinase